MITTENLKAKVRFLLNEANDDSDVTLLTVDTRKIDDYIEMLLPEAVLFVQKNSNRCGVNTKSATIAKEKITTAADGSGYLPLPDDFVRLVKLQMTGWKRPCNILYPNDTAIALAQGNVHTRAGWCKPIAVQDYTAEGLNALFFYSLPVGVAPNVEAFIYEARYVPENGLSGNDDTLHEAVAYQCAALVFNVFDKRDSAASMLSIAASLCNGNSNNEK
ncbi:MAG: hypothetical protein IKJ31_05805 [Bacteroidaceae bacterium]|nr:hypothetical protein [Bacteroidaceae bacterium]